MQNKKVYHGLAILLMFIWGLSYLSIKVVVSEIEPTLVAFYRFLIASIILYTIMKLKYPEEKVLKEDKLKMMIGGFFGVALYFFFENYAVSFTSASNVSILISSIPIFTLLSQRIIFKEKLTTFKILGATLSVIGIIIVVSSKDKVNLFSSGTLGDLMALGAAISWVIYNIVTSKFKGEYKSITISAYQTIFGTIFLSPALLISKPTMPSNLAIINILYLSIACSVAGYIIYIFCLKKLGPTVITTYINLQPIISLSASALILKESVAFIQVIGSIIIITGVFLVNFEDKFSKKTFEKSI
ncbi:membrane spanning protein [Clostridium putrefaciens]|uniref:Membrane spanning protein n=1 Tax=Clostridium putrefaciens TaxID=99675 RepID=A0A381J8N0_9CLOT|nr:DMT family transporter [Clostridium putrefaciens]SUY46757.1 membrane spanning protein [Clostridium putrefaciens]